MDKKNVIQSKIFLESEGNQWFKRNEKTNPADDYKIAIERKILAEWCSTRKDKISNILEIGAGKGLPLAYLSKELNADAIGIEPSIEAIDKWQNIRKNVDGGERTSLKNGIASDLPFENDKFDLVIFGFCLCWIERESLFKSISEADRVLKDGGLMSIIDFDPSGAYANPYAHKEPLKTFKTNYSDICLASNHYALMYNHSFSLSGKTFAEKIDERMSLSILYKQEYDVYFQYKN